MPRGPPMSKPFAKKTAIVTGSTSGIGLAIAKALAKGGAHVMMNGLGTAQDKKAAIEAVSALKGNVAFDGANMLKPDEIAVLIQKTEKLFGAVDILVNNAGIQHVAPIETFPVDKWDQVLAINLSSSFHTIRAALPGMKARNFGRIINVASAHSLTASPFKTAYVAAKHGIAGLTKAVALEVADHDITCNAVSPGFVWTPLVEKQIPDLAKSEGISLDEAKKKVLTRQPTQRFITVDEVAATVAYLADPATKSVTGTNISIDGAWTAQ
jgi:3-hydroxybutyrate dehydrogenase